MIFGATPFSPPPGEPIWDIPRRPRYFDRVDTVTGTPEADTFEVEPLRRGYYPTDSGRLRGLGRSTAPLKEQPETTEIVVLDDGGRGECNSFGCTWIPFAEPLPNRTGPWRQLQNLTVI